MRLSLDAIWRNSKCYRTPATTCSSSAQLQGRSTETLPIAVTVRSLIFLFSPLFPSTVDPDEVEAKCALQCARMLTLPRILTVVRRQYQPLGFNNSMVVPPITLKLGLINTRVGELVGSVSAAAFPIPNTLADVPKVLNCGDFPKG